MLSWFSEEMQLVALCGLWYAGSMMNSIFAKSALKKYPAPVSVFLFQLIVINAILPLTFHGKVKTIRRGDWTKWVLPLSGLKLLASLSSQLSILKVPVSYAHTVKAIMPIFTVLLSRIFLRQQHTTLIYLSLLPIVGGIAIASATELEFDFIGLISAVTSTFLFAVQSIYSKKVMTGMDHTALLIIISRVCLGALLPYWWWAEGSTLLVHGDLYHFGYNQGMLFVAELLLTGLANTVQTVFAFTFLSKVTAVTYSIANVTKRVVIIIVSMIVFSKPVSFLNALGMATTIGGIALYNFAKLHQRDQQRTQSRSQQMQGGLTYLNSPTSPSQGGFGMPI
eukprot:m.227918 g.227918  ORF g.227918 m.227918 type:complete len:337 (-) comp15185_c0_seq2:69-1079(-)